MLWLARKIGIRCNTIVLLPAILEKKVLTEYMGVKIIDEFIMRNLLLILVIFVAITAFIAGLPLIAYRLGAALGFSIDFSRLNLLTYSLIPAIAISVIGCINAGAAFAMIQKSKNQYRWSLAGGLSLCIAIAVLELFIEKANWIFYSYFACGVAIILVSWQIKGRWAV